MSTPDGWDDFDLRAEAEIRYILIARHKQSQQAIDRLGNRATADDREFNARLQAWLTRVVDAIDNDELLVSLGTSEETGTEAAA